MHYDMTPYEQLADQFSLYLDSKSGELETGPGMRRIQLCSGENYPKIECIKEDFCALHGVNSSDINVRWALGHGVTNYCLLWLCGELPV